MFMLSHYKLINRVCNDFECVCPELKEVKFLGSLFVPFSLHFMRLWLRRNIHGSGKSEDVSVHMYAVHGYSLVNIVLIFHCFSCPSTPSFLIFFFLRTFRLSEKCFLFKYFYILQLTWCGSRTCRTTFTFVLLFLNKINIAFIKKFQFYD